MSLNNYDKYYRYGKIFFVDKDSGLTRIGYKCRKCKDNTPHLYLTQSGDNIIYYCLICKTLKSIYVGYRDTYTRSNMTIPRR